MARDGCEAPTPAFSGPVQPLLTTTYRFAETANHLQILVAQSNHGWESWVESTDFTKALHLKTSVSRACLAQYVTLFVVLCMPEPRSLAYRRLYEAAEGQQGFFTTKQAKAAGFAENTHPYHVQAGNWIREHRGIYRLALFPATDHPDLAQWALWSRNRREETDGVYSHQTALSLWELSDLNPSKLHMTVPKRFRRNSKLPSILVLYYADLRPGDIETAQGYKFTKPLRTILDLIEEDSVSNSIVRQAIRQSFERGLVARKQIKTTQMTNAARTLFEAELRRGRS